MGEITHRPGYIYATLESHIDSLNSANDITTYWGYPLTLRSQYGDYFEIVDGNIVCKKTCIAEICVQVYLYTGFGANDVVGARLFNKTTEKIAMQANATARKVNPYEINRCGPVVRKLNAGDVLNFQARNTYAARGKIVNYNHSTFVTIKTLIEFPEEAE